MSKFAERFKQIKNKYGFTLQNLSDGIGVSVTNLSYYTNGREPNYDTLIKIAQYFNVTVDWLIGNEKDITQTEQEKAKLLQDKQELLKANKNLEHKLEKIKRILDESL